jgi:hypothetical protein
VHLGEAAIFVLVAQEEARFVFKQQELLRITEVLPRRVVRGMVVQVEMAEAEVVLEGRFIFQHIQLQEQRVQFLPRVVQEEVIREIQVTEVEVEVEGYRLFIIIILHHLFLD